jgi:hypothetical protein
MAPGVARFLYQHAPGVVKVVALRPKVADVHGQVCDVNEINFRAGRRVLVAVGETVDTDPAAFVKEDIADDYFPAGRIIRDGAGVGNINPRNRSDGHLAIKSRALAVIHESGIYYLNALPVKVLDDGHIIPAVARGPEDLTVLKLEHASYRRDN